MVRIRKPVVYIASPYTKGDVAVNTRFQMELVHAMMDGGLVIPIAPLLSHFLHLFQPRPYQDWIDYDLELLHVVDACVRLPAVYPAMDYKVTESSGADNEVKRCIELGKPVFYDVADLHVWASEVWPKVAKRLSELPPVTDICHKPYSCSDQVLGELRRCRLDVGDQYP